MTASLLHYQCSVPFDRIASNMARSPNSESIVEDSSSGGRTVFFVGLAVLLMTVGLVAIAIVLAGNSQTAGPSVRVVRDILIIVMALEFILSGVAFVIFLVQVARLINLVQNEIRPLIGAATDTVNTVRGTAAFVSKTIVEPVNSVNDAVRGLTRLVGDIEAIRRAAGVVMNASTETSSRQRSTSDNFDAPTDVLGPHGRSTAGRPKRRSKGETKES